MRTSVYKLAMLLPFMVALAPAHAADIVVPGANATRSGGSNQGFPFNLAAGVSQRYQQLYASNQFGSAPVTLYGIKFRQASDPSGGNPFAATIPSITLSLGIAATRVGAASSVFADNIGANYTNVFSGALSLSSTAPALRNGGVQPFDIVIAFTTPFTYDPSRGDLLLDVLNISGGATTAFDFITGGSDAVSRVVGPQGQAGATGVLRPAGRGPRHRVRHRADRGGARAGDLGVRDRRVRHDRRNDAPPRPCDDRLRLTRL